MALIACKECGKPISSDAKSCPGCGAKPPTPKVAAYGCLLLCILFFGSCVALASLSNGGDKKATIPDIDRSPEQRQRRALIDKLISRGIFQKVERPGEVPHVWVTPLFMALNFDDKQSFISVVYAYYGDDLVSLRDSKTGGRIGTFSPSTGLSL